MYDCSNSLNKTNKMEIKDGDFSFFFSRERERIIIHSLTILSENDEVRIISHSAIGFCFSVDCYLSKKKKKKKTFKRRGFEGLIKSVELAVAFELHSCEKKIQPIHIGTKKKVFSFSPVRVSY